MLSKTCSEPSKLSRLNQLHHQFVCTDNHDRGTYMSWNENSDCKRPDRHP